MGQMWTSLFIIVFMCSYSLKKFLILPFFFLINFIKNSIIVLKRFDEFFGWTLLGWVFLERDYLNNKNDPFGRLIENKRSKG